MSMVKIKNLQKRNHSFGTDLHFGPGEIQEVDEAILLKYGNPPSEFALGMFEIVSEPKPEAKAEVKQEPMQVFESVRGKRKF